MSRLSKNASFVRGIMEMEIDHDSPLQLMQKLEKLSNIVGLCAEMVAESERECNRKQLEVLNRIKDDGLSATVIQKTIKLETCEQEAMAKYCDRLCAGITHEMDALRSILSYLKTEMERL